MQRSTVVRAKFSTAECSTKQDLLPTALESLLTKVTKSSVDLAQLRPKDFIFMHYFKLFIAPFIQVKFIIIPATVQIKLPRPHFSHVKFTSDHFPFKVNA